ncbi:MAG: PAS domain-containing protein, partial [Candidatus Omnitrophota bacterium]
GKTDYDFFPKELSEKYRADDKRIIKSGKSETIEEKYLQDGLETIVNTVKTPITDEQGNVTGILGIFWDITEQKKAQEKIKQAAEEWDRTFNTISDLVFIADKELNILKCNRAFAAALKTKPEEIIGKKCYELLHKSDKPWPNCPFEVAKIDKKAHMQEVYDPNIGIPLLVTVSPLFDDKQEVIGAVHIARDITELKKNENKLKEAMRIKSEFTSMVSHELRTPLTAIKEGIAIVLDGTAGKIAVKQKEFLNTAKRNVDRLARLINDVLSFQRLEAGRMEFKMEKNNINVAVKEVQKTMTPLAKEKKLNLISKLDKKLPKTKFDKDSITQVLTNIINNALKFTEKGSIVISTKKDRKANAIRVSVKDTGPGIKKQDISKLFQRFEQIESSKERKTGGTGLGLAISKEIIQKHKGKIWAESGLNKGMTIHFILPIKA